MTLAWTMYAHDHNDAVALNLGDRAQADWESWVRGILSLDRCINHPVAVPEHSTNRLFLQRSVLSAYTGSPSLGLWRCAWLPNPHTLVYYLPGTKGWGTTFASRPTMQWWPLILNSGPSLGVQTNAFGFIISWATNVPVVVEASANCSHPVWSPVSTNTLIYGWSYFSDSDWINYPNRFYRVRSP